MIGTQAEPRIGAAVLGATGVVGQRFVSLLQRHPWFELRSLVGRRAVGKTYADASPWRLEAPLGAQAADLRVEGLEALEARNDVQAVFSALPSGTAGPIETRLARRGLKVFTNARDHRLDPDVPLLVPEVNPDHAALVQRQPGPGWIVANGNCTGIILTLALAPLHRTFGLASVHVTSMQGLSGAGHPGVSALDILDNVIPHIPGEEEKLAAEPNKTLGALGAQGVAPAGIPIHATCTRVPVLEGHLESVHVRLDREATAETARRAFAEFRAPLAAQGLPTAPAQPIRVRAEQDRPQPRRDRDEGNGMSVSVGRLRLSDDGRDLRFVLLGHNTLRGAAGQSVLNAELLARQGLLRDAPKAVASRPNASATAFE